MPAREEKTPDSPVETNPTGDRIAVIAIHGVGDHQPFATAREIGNLLSALEYHPSGTPRYAPFTEIVKRVNVRPVRTVDHWKQEPWREGHQHLTWGPLDAIAQAAYDPAMRSKTLSAVDAVGLDHLFMYGQLAEYKGEKPEDTYELLRLEGRRIAPPAESNPTRQSIAPDAAGEMATELREHGIKTPQTRAVEASGELVSGSLPGTNEKVVHVYEMYWADLSRLSTAFTQIFGELYQLLFHLGSVGANNVKAAAVHLQDRSGSNAWKMFDRAQTMAVATLAWPIPILNLFIAALVPSVLIVSLMRTHLSAAQEFFALEAIVCVLATVGCGLVLLKRDLLSMPAYVTPLLCITAAGVLIALITYRAGQIPDREETEAWCAIVISALAYGGVALIIKAYSKRRPGSGIAALWIALIFVGCVALLMHLWTFLYGPRYFAILACLNFIEIAAYLLIVFWFLFYLCYAWAQVAGWLAVHATKPKRGEASDRGSEAAMDYLRTRRTRWTAKLLLALPSTMFAVLTLAVWTGVIKVAVPFLPGQANAPHDCPIACTTRDANPQKTSSEMNAACTGASCQPVQYTSISAALRKHGKPDLSDSRCASCWVDLTMKTAGIRTLPILLLGMLLSLLIAAWALFPVVWTEVSPPRQPMQGEGHERDLNREARSLGDWLSKGFRFMHVSGSILYWFMFAGILVPFISLLLHKLVILTPTRQGQVIDLTNVLGTLVVGAAVGIFGFGGRLKNIALGFRPVVRVMLDVDNWLREHPRDSNPTARICGRYISLIRHILAWRDPHGNPYNALVIVAHSQGTVITADLLRFLNTERRIAGAAGYDPEIDRLDPHNPDALPIYLFTMGCPLRQLYGLRFPYLYSWARGATGEQPPADMIPNLRLTDTPDPDSLGVKQWINAFRSGDYVGRHVWRSAENGYGWKPMAWTGGPDWDPPAGKPEHISSDAEGKRIEFSIGAGAHTHYWDSTAGLIAEVLDRVINAA
ncbi:MAG: hypothetical protein ACR2IV_24250 [Bryobacteraceae bacterium]